MQYRGNISALLCWKGYVQTHGNMVLRMAPHIYTRHVYISCVEDKCEQQTSAYYFSEEKITVPTLYAYSSVLVS